MPFEPRFAHALFVSTALALAGCAAPPTATVPDPGPAEEPEPEAAADRCEGEACGPGAEAPVEEEPGSADADAGSPVPDAEPPGDAAPPPFVESVENCTFETTGRNPFFVLEPGYVLVLEGRENGERLKLVMTVLDETVVVDGVETRVLLEEEYEDGDVEERSRNYFAICAETGSVFYFGEDVDIYEDDEVVSHEGAWRAGQAGARAGIMMPGAPEVGMEHDQEHAPGVALDHAEIVATDDVVETPAGRFTGALKVKETSPLAPDEVEFKWYAPGIGVVVDGPLELSRLPG